MSNPKMKLSKQSYLSQKGQWEREGGREEGREGGRSYSDKCKDELIFHPCNNTIIDCIVLHPCNFKKGLLQNHPGGEG